MPTKKAVKAELPPVGIRHSPSFIDAKHKKAIKERIDKASLSEKDLENIIMALNYGNGADMTNATYLFRSAILKYHEDMHMTYLLPEHTHTALELTEELLKILIHPNDKTKMFVTEYVVKPIMAKGNGYQKQVVFHILLSAKHMISNELSMRGFLLREPER